jgi:signal transduction histidine kinase
MYKRLIILSVIILSALCGLTLLGYHAVEKWAEGLKGARLGKFAEVAEQIRQDVKGKLDEFMQTEQDRPYSDYNYYYVPQNVALGQQRQMPLLRSPLAGGLNNSFAWGNFQINPDGSIITPNDDIVQREGATEENKRLYAKVQFNRNNIETNLLPVLTALKPDSFKTIPGNEVSSSLKTTPQTSEEAKLVKGNVWKSKDTKGGGSKSRQGKAFPIKSLQADRQKTQVFKQQRQQVITNTSANQELTPRQRAVSPTSQSSAQMGSGLKEIEEARQSELFQPQEEQIEQSSDINDELQLYGNQGESETVQIRLGVFETIVTGGENADESIFGGQAFLVRDVQIEDRHFLQGFQLNENVLVQEAKESAARFMREGMRIELSQTEDEDSAYTAILDFGFGDLVLNLKEIDPAWISKKIHWLRNWYFSIITIVLLAATLGLAGLWRNARAQIKLAQKKDDFISAVSHELRTPLTSIRMYSEMLEKNWVKSEDKLPEYYKNMRQESERLSRLIENVLDFSRIQRGRKKYTFSVGNINECIADVVEMMTPYAEQSGFSIKMDLEHTPPTAFDSDAVTQIVVNLLDNAIKYARDADDKTITVRTKSDEQFILIEVEDHGPGVPHRQRKKIFEEFYRIGAEATRETAGTGLGLALVKKFAQAHRGFVEIITAKPTGAIFRVALAAQI